ncbi:hypothetical protein [Microbispora rosea]|uniref:hypothetical protein n=1 Tax=Microbispora rosea TaxID=58117 RepID=UPI00341D7378
MSIPTSGKVKVAVAIGLLSLATACGSAQAAAGAQPDTMEAVAKLDTIQAYSFPLDQYKETPAQRAQLTNGLRSALGKCMERFGFANRFTAKVPVGTDPFPRDRRYLFIDPDLTAKYGYAGMPQKDDSDKDAPDAGRARSASTPSRAPMSVEEQSLLTGEGQQTVNGKSMPSEGCTGEARRAVSASTSADDEWLLTKLENLASDQSEQAPDVVGATKAWSQCMRRAGYAYDTPQQAWEDPRWGPRRDGGALSKEEIDTSTTDMKCKLEVNYLGLRAQAEADAQRRLITENQEALRAYQKNLQTKVQNADKLLAG